MKLSIMCSLEEKKNEITNQGPVRRTFVREVEEAVYITVRLVSVYVLGWKNRVSQIVFITIEEWYVHKTTK